MICSYSWLANHVSIAIGVEYSFDMFSIVIIRLQIVTIHVSYDYRLMAFTI